MSDNDGDGGGGNPIHPIHPDPPDHSIPPIPPDHPVPPAPTLHQLFVLFVRQLLRLIPVLPNTLIVPMIACRLDVNSLNGLLDLLIDLRHRCQQSQTGNALIVPQYPQEGVVTHNHIAHITNGVNYLNQVIVNVQLFIDRTNQA